MMLDRSRRRSAERLSCVGLLALAACNPGSGNDAAVPSTDVAADGAADGASDGDADAPATIILPTLNLTWPVATCEAEAGQLVGSAATVGAPDESDRTVGDLGGEASHRRAVVLTAAGDAVSWVIQPAETGANAFVTRFSIPDAPMGGGQSGTLDLSVQSASGVVRLQTTLRLTSRYAWLYGGVMDGTKLYNVPANATQYGTAPRPTHLYDEIQRHLGIELHAGDTLMLTKTATSGVTTLAIDFIDLETVPAPLAQPTGFLSLTDPQCGAIPLDLRGTGTVFDGEDDSSYGNLFNTVLGHNPNNPTSFGVIEKDYYLTARGDALQDRTPNQSTGGMSLFSLADHNQASLQTCARLVTTAGSGYAGVYIPPGRFYARGTVALPSGVTVQGAGMWYSKLVAVDSDVPMPTTVRGSTGIASVSGNLVFTSVTGGSSHVTLSNFAVFHNVTQRDVVDAVIPMAFHGVLTDSTLDNLWVEHTFIGLNTNGASSGVTISNSRVRNTFADGIDFYGSTVNSTIRACSARSTGDDGFAVWSQGTTLDTTSHGNTISGSTASLQWYGNGFAIYGGVGEAIDTSRASDILNYPCVQVSTQFVSPLLPSTASMSASASNLALYRCGGDGFNQQFGALLVGAATENVNGVTVRGVRIESPTYAAIEFRTFANASGPATLGTANGVTIQDVEVLGASECAQAATNVSGSAALVNVCTCPLATSAPSVCGVTNGSVSMFTIAPNTCTATSCAGP